MDHQVVAAGMAVHELAGFGLFETLGGGLACLYLGHNISPDARPRDLPQHLKYGTTL
jgi:hypothetical protein